ncbi:hypothetical protein VPH35_113817 [Triticum aestivum]
MASIDWVLLLFLAVLPAVASSGAHGDDNLTLRCLPDQAVSLLQLKKTFSFFRYPSPLESWQDGTDCCLWEGVGCSNSSGHVTALELGGRGLYSPGLDPAIFKLTSLQLLDLSMNSFGAYSLPATGFESLSLLTHLNLSSSGLHVTSSFYMGTDGPGTETKTLGLGAPDQSTNVGLDSPSFYLGLLQREINSNNISTKLTTNSLWLDQRNFQILVTNLSSLRELYLNRVYIRGWCRALAKYLPKLRFRSLSFCNLVGPICPSLSNLHSLTEINLLLKPQHFSYLSSYSNGGERRRTVDTRFSGRCTNAAMDARKP